MYKGALETGSGCHRGLKGLQHFFFKIQKEDVLSLQAVQAKVKLSYSMGFHNTDIEHCGN